MARLDLGELTLMLKKPDIDQELAQLFLISARCACFKQTARSLNTHSTIVRRRLAKLESQIGAPLFSHQGRTLGLTEAGRALYQLLQSRFGDLRPALPSSKQALLRLACPDTLLNTLLARSLVSFVRQHAAMRLEIQALNDMPMAQAEVMVWMGDPDAPRPTPDFAMTKPRLLGRIGYCAHVAKRYSGGKGALTSADGLRDYMLVQHRANGANQAFSPWNELVQQRHGSVAIVHSLELVQGLVKSSACIGLLPEFSSQLDRTLLPLPSIFSSRMERCVWMSTTPLAAQREEVQTIANLIISTFDERRDWLEGAPLA